MTRPSDTAYIYASTKVKSADGAGTEASRLKALLDCTTVRDVYDAVVDSAICPTAEKRAVSGDSDAVLAASEILESALDYAADLVREAVPEPELYSFLFYKYDCNTSKRRSNLIFAEYPQTAQCSHVQISHPSLPRNV